MVKLKEGMRNYHLDLVKILASMLVVLIHVGGNTTGNKYFKPVLDLAVPCFFMISGYLVGHRSQEYLISYIKSIIKMYVSTAIFYWVIDYFVYTTTEGFKLTVKGYITTYLLPRVTKGGLIAGEIGKYHLWYLWASIIGFIIFMLIKKLKVPDWLMVIMGLIGYLISLNNPTVYITNGGFPKAFLFVSLGYLLHQRTTVVKDNKRFVVLPILLVLIFTLPEIRMRSTIPYMVEMMVVLTSLSLMYFVVTTYLPSNKLIKWGSKLTDSIYLLHPLAIQILVNTAGYEVGEGWNRTGAKGTYVLYTLSMILTLILVIITNRLKPKVSKLLRLRT